MEIALFIECGRRLKAFTKKYCNLSIHRIDYVLGWLNQFYHNAWLAKPILS